MVDPPLTRWQIEVPAARAEEAIAILLEAFPGGLQEVARGATIGDSAPKAESSGTPPSSASRSARIDS